MKIGQKLILSFVGVALLIGIVGYISVFSSQKISEEFIGESSVLLVSEVMDKIDRNIYDRIEEFRFYSKNSLLQNTVIESNKKFEQMQDIQGYIDEQDQKWRAADKEEITPFMGELIDNNLSKEMKEMVDFYDKEYGYKLYGEIFVTNKYSTNVAQTDKTSDYRQDDEEWWQLSRQNDFNVGDIEYDESADVYSTVISIRIDDKDGNFIGFILKK